MTLPIVMIFENHWDEIPKHILSKILPKLKTQGYNTLCLEIPETTTREEFLEGIDSKLKNDKTLISQAFVALKNAGIEKNLKQLCELPLPILAELMRQYVSSNHYNECTEIIRNFSAEVSYNLMIKSALKFEFDLRNIDLSGISKILSLAINDRVRALDETMESRDSKMADHLINLYNQEKGIIFLCGAAHYEGIFSIFQQNNMADNIVCYFPSTTNSQFLPLGAPKERISHLSKSDTESFAEKIIADVKKHESVHAKALQTSDEKSYDIFAGAVNIKIKELPHKINVKNEHGQTIANFDVPSENRETLFQLRRVIGKDVIKKLAFQPVYEVHTEWLQNMLAINSNGVSELAGMLGISVEDLMKSTCISPEDKFVMAAAQVSYPSESATYSLSR